MTNVMCDDLDKARQNRERVKEGYGNDFYDEQVRCLAQWTSKRPPGGLILGELPVVRISSIRFDKGG